MTEKDSVWRVNQKIVTSWIALLHYLFYLNNWDYENWKIAFHDRHDLGTILNA